jgi:phage protein D
MVMDGHLMSQTQTDNRGFEADRLYLELEEADVMIELPRRGEPPGAGLERSTAVT